MIFRVVTFTYEASEQVSSVQVQAIHKEDHERGADISVVEEGEEVEQREERHVHCGHGSF